MKTNLLKIIGLFSLGIGLCFSFTFADDDKGSASLNYTILPEIDEDKAKSLNEKINDIGATGGQVNSKYNEYASGMSVPDSLASGIMTRDTLIDYLVYVVKFLSQLGLAIGAGFIIYAGYTYMLSVFGGKAKPDVIKNAIIGVTIVIFSYAIMKTLTAIFLGS